MISCQPFYCSRKLDAYAPYPQSNASSIFSLLARLLPSRSRATFCDTVVGLTLLLFVLCMILIGKYRATCARLVPSNTCIMRTGKTRGLHCFLHVAWNDGVSRLESAVPQGMEESDSERGTRSHPLSDIKCGRWRATRASTRRSCASATWIAFPRRASSRSIGCLENRRARSVAFINSYEIKPYTV